MFDKISSSQDLIRDFLFNNVTYYRVKVIIERMGGRRPTWMELRRQQKIKQLKKQYRPSFGAVLIGCL
tara:strand:+ start:286 stop:489 length:204 start_codon:yes stop_codon:yes gene_type:complete